MSTTDTHKHATIGEAGQCPECRAATIAMMSDDPYGFLVLFARPGASDVEAIAAVRYPGPDPDAAHDTTWATGCNAGDEYGAGTLGPFDPDDLPDAFVALVPWFQLTTGPAVTTVLEWLELSTAVAEIEAFRASLHGHGGCSECGVPLNASPN